MHRILCVLAAVAALALGTPANALTCPMLTDNLGDGRATVVLGVESDALDIVSADLASGATTVSVVLRVAALPDDPILRLGVTWAVTWQIDGTALTVEARRPPGGNAAYSGAFSYGPVAFAVDVAGGTFTWTIDRAAIPQLDTPRRKFMYLSATTKLSWQPADMGWSAQTYVDRDPACITAA